MTGKFWQEIVFYLNENTKDILCPGTLLFLNVACLSISEANKCLTDVNI